MGWINVNDRLPEQNVAVLAVFASGEMVVCRIYDIDETWVLWRAETDDGWECEMDFSPTHWMPLPEPPKEE